MQVTVYGGAGCVACTFIKRMLKQAGVAFDEKDAVQDCPEEILRTARHLPIVVSEYVNDGTEIIEWFDGNNPDRAKQLIELWRKFNEPS